MQAQAQALQDAPPAVELGGERRACSDYADSIELSTGPAAAPAAAPAPAAHR